MIDVLLSLSLLSSTTEPIECDPELGCIIITDDGCDKPTGCPITGPAPKESKTVTIARRIIPSQGPILEVGYQATITGSRQIFNAGGAVVTVYDVTYNGHNYVLLAGDFR
jgi:hypothetical protein